MKRKQELIEMLRRRIELADNLLNTTLIVDKSEAADLLRELEGEREDADCVHPWASILGDGDMSPAKCLRCGKVLST